MMLIATTAAIALFATGALAAAPAASATSIPPMIVSVTSAADISPQLLSRVFAEADAIWRSSGVSFVWQRVARGAATYARTVEIGPLVPNTLRLSIGDQRGTPGNGRLPLGWIVFAGGEVPEQEIYLSRANAMALMADARGVVGLIDQMPIAQREMLLARAMGRALAHELGHYLFASKAHTPRGLMKAIVTAAELFQPDNRSFHIEPAQRSAVAARLRGEPLVAQWPSS